MGSVGAKLTPQGKCPIDYSQLYLALLQSLDAPVSVAELKYFGSVYVHTFKYTLFILIVFCVGGSKRKSVLYFHIAQLRREECYMKTHTAQEVNIAQLEEVTQLTVNRILESALAMATTMTCCSARRTNRPQRESEE